MYILLHWLGPRVKNLKGQGLFSKNPGADRYAVRLTRLGLTAAVGSRSGGPGKVGRGSDGGSAGARRRTTAGSPEFANPAFQGLVQGVVWPWVEYATRVTQLGTHGGGLGPGRSSPRRGAALGGDARRSAACKPFCGSGACAKRVWGLHKTRERLCRGRAGQRGAVGHPPWQGRGVRGGENAGVRCPGT